MPEKKSGAVGDAPKIYRNPPLQTSSILKKRLLREERALHKGTFALLLQRAEAKAPRAPPLLTSQLHRPKIYKYNALQLYVRYIISKLSAFVCIGSITVKNRVVWPGPNIVLPLDYTSTSIPVDIKIMQHSKGYDDGKNVSERSEKAEAI